MRDVLNSMILYDTKGIMQYDSNTQLIFFPPQNDALIIYKSLDICDLRRARFAMQGIKQSLGLMIALGTGIKEIKKTLEVLALDCMNAYDRNRVYRVEAEPCEPRKNYFTYLAIGVKTLLLLFDMMTVFGFSSDGIDFRSVKLKLSQVKYLVKSVVSFKLLQLEDKYDKLTTSSKSDIELPYKQLRNVLNFIVENEIEYQYDQSVSKLQKKCGASSLAYFEMVRGVATKFVVCPYAIKGFLIKKGFDIDVLNGFLDILYNYISFKTNNVLPIKPSFYSTDLNNCGDNPLDQKSLSCFHSTFVYTTKLNEEVKLKEFFNHFINEEISYCNDRAEFYCASQNSIPKMICLNSLKDSCRGAVPGILNEGFACVSTSFPIDFWESCIGPNIDFDGVNDVKDIKTYPCGYDDYLCQTDKIATSTTCNGKWKFTDDDWNYAMML